MNDYSEQLLPTFEPSEADLIQRALDQPLDVKIKKSIAMLQMYEQSALKLSPDGFYLAFSGGKDSCVIKQLAIEAGVKFKAWYNLTTIDPPELVRFIKRHHAEVSWNKPARPMLQELVLNARGLPSRQVRWCCQLYKENGGDGSVRIIGVRISESKARSLRWKEFNQSKHGVKVCPIVYWTDEDVWAFIRSRNLPYCELYDQGFKRLGCVGCPLIGKEGMDKGFARWPKYETAWKRAAERFWDKWHGVPLLAGGDRSFEKFGSAEGLWQWWRSGKAFTKDTQCTFDEMMEQR